MGNYRRGETVRSETVPHAPTLACIDEYKLHRDWARHECEWGGTRERFSLEVFAELGEVIDIGTAPLERYRHQIAWFDPGQTGLALLGNNPSASGPIRSFLDSARIAPPSGPWATRMEGKQL